MRFRGFELRRRLLPLVALLALAAPPSGLAQEAPRRTGELIVRLAPGALIEEAITELSLGPLEVRPVRLLVPRLNIWLVAFDESGLARRGGHPTDALEQARSASRIVSAQFNHEVRHRGVHGAVEAGPSDVRFSEQWALNNTGQTGGKPGADVRALAAWQIASGGPAIDGPEVVIAVIDNGFDLDHRDLLFFKNVHDDPTSGVDDDGNGYVDDYHGWNAATNSGQITSRLHGTHVAGIAAARGNNAEGIAGVSWNARVMPIQGASGGEATVVAAYGYALTMRSLFNETGGERGAFIVATNSSFGIDEGDPKDFPIWCNMYDEMGAVGIVSAAATMNKEADVDVVGDMPSACPSPWLIAVTSTTHQDERSQRAAFGRNTVDLGAPGTEILSTVPGQGYGLASGTSMAAPHVAGAVGLLVSGFSTERLEQYRERPAEVSLQLRRSILDGATDIGLATTTGGRLDLFGALLESLHYDPRTILLEENTTLADAILEGERLIVPEGITLTIENALTLRADGNGRPSLVIVHGRIEGEADLQLLDGSDIIVRPGAEMALFPHPSSDAGFALALDGDSALLVEPSESLAVGEEMTFMTWLSHSGAPGTVVDLSTDSTVSFRLSLDRIEGRLVLAYAHSTPGGGEERHVWPYDLKQVATHHVTLLRGAGTVELLIDGRSAGPTFAYAQPPAEAHGAQLVVGNVRGGSAGLAGSLDEVVLLKERVDPASLLPRIFHTLSRGDVPASSVAYYKFDGHDPGVALDYSGRNNRARSTSAGRVRSPFPVGHHAVVLDEATVRAGTVGLADASLLAEVTSVSDEFQLALYSTRISDDLVEDADGLPAGVALRSATVWGARALGDITARLSIAFYSPAGQDYGEAYVLHRASAGKSWTDASDSWHQEGHTFSIAGASTFGEWAIGYGRAVGNEITGTPDRPSLRPAYPNPTRGRLTLMLELPEVQVVTVDVIDLLGRRAGMVHEGLLAPGSHELTFDGSSLSAGHYLVRAVGEGFSAVQRITLLR
jgi:hypothetical protein